MRRISPYLIKLCRELRHTSTDAEELLWRCLRRKQLAGFKFRRQHPIHRYITDFCCPEAHVIIELDGSVHDTSDRVKYDEEREDYLRQSGYKVLRFRNSEVVDETEAVLEKILSTLTPTPLPSRERGKGRG